MSNIHTLLEEAQRCNVELWVEQGKLKFRAPNGALKAELKESISMNKAELIAFLNKKQAEITDSTQPSPLSHGQIALWYIYQANPLNSAYNMDVCLHITSDLDIDALKWALNELVTSHRILSTTIHQKYDEPFQLEDSAAKPELEVLSTEHCSLEELLPVLKKKACEPFRLSEFGCRFTLYRRNRNSNILLLGLHHIFGDAFSLALLTKELHELYTNKLEGKKTNRAAEAANYAEYVAYENRLLNSPKGLKLQQFWRNELAGASGELRLPGDAIESQSKIKNLETNSFQLAESSSNLLKKLAAKHKTSLSNVVLASVQTLLYRYSGQSDFCIGMPTSAGRLNPIFSSTVGYLVNPVVIRAKITSSDIRFSTHLTNLHEQMIRIMEHQAYPFPLIVKDLKFSGANDQSPLFRVMFSIYSKELSTSPNTSSVLNYHYLQLDREHEQFDLVFDVIDSKQLKVSISTKVIEKNILQQMSQHLQNLLEAISISPAQPLCKIPMQTGDELNHLKNLALGTKAERPDKTIVGCFTDTAFNWPQLPALVVDGQTQSYEMLHDKAMQIAAILEKQDLKHQSVIALTMPRTADMVAATLAILGRGHVLLPLDSNYPEQIRDHILKTADAALVLGIASQKAQYRQHRFLALDDTTIITSEKLPLDQSSLNDTAYIIFTSGSTGMPKGVKLGHKALANRISAAASEYQITRGERVLHFSTISFDAAIEQLWTPLSCAATIVLRGEKLWSAEETIKNIQQEQIQVIDLPLTYWREVMRELESMESPDQYPDSIRLTILGGEVLAVNDVHMWQRSPFSRGRLLNCYGPTEATIGCSSYEINAHTDEADFINGVPIGRPTANAEIYILDEDNNLMPAGAIGEICIGGGDYVLAEGYVNNPDLTREKFVETVFGRLYRSGDLGQFREDGQLLFKGRKDRQSKVRGYRIEPESIELALKDAPSVDDAFVLTENDNVAAVIISKREDKEFVKDIRKHISHLLPDYMTPGKWLVLEQVPREVGGKVDFKQLSERLANSQQDAAGLESPETATEIKLAEIWSDVLGSNVQIKQADFFELGGHSLALLRMLARVKQEFDIEIGIATFFTVPSLEKLAAYIDKPEKTDTQEVIVELHKGDPDDNRVVLLIPGTADNLSSFIGLAKSWSYSASLYGIQPPVLDHENQQGEEVLNKLCALLLSEISEKDFTGPYVLAGHSTGGLIACELAKRMQASGKSVQAVVLLDTYAPGFSNDSSPWNAGNMTEFQFFSHMIFARLGIKAGAEATFESMDTLLQTINAEEPVMSVSDLETLFLQFRQTEKMALDSVSDPGVPVKLILATGNEHLPTEASETLNKDRGWGKILHKELITARINANHFTMLSDQNAAELAKIIPRLLEENSTHNNRKAGS